jgi:ribonuclease BN (tRNA processing enzyme)
MRLTVLGSSASYAGARQACSGYLVESDGTRVLLDCGNGALANATAVADVTALDAVFVSHTHPDHFADLYALQAALRYAPEGPSAPLPLHLPSGLFGRLGAVLSERGRHEFEAAFLPHVLSDDVPVEIGAITVTPRVVDHDTVAFGFRVESGDARFCYTGDTRHGEAVLRLTQRCRVLVAECTLPSEFAGRAPHMTPGEAGRLASASGTRLLVLTHIWPTADRDRLLADARAEFAGDVVIAEELMDIEIEQVAFGA